VIRTQGGLMPSLQDRFDARRNGFDVLRLLFALLVATAHGISAHTGGQPRIGLSGIGDFALDGFFVLSGFLVTRSWFRLESFPRFAWHRFLRIMPGFWVCLVVVAFVAAELPRQANRARPEKKLRPGLAR
jgi:peptidoglycan/LPS O-acetylase OafA/YrhL